MSTTLTPTKNGEPVPQAEKMDVHASVKFMLRELHGADVEKVKSFLDNFNTANSPAQNLQLVLVTLCSVERLRCTLRTIAGMYRDEYAPNSKFAWEEQNKEEQKGEQQK